MPELQNEAGRSRPDAAAGPLLEINLLQESIGSLSGLLPVRRRFRLPGWPVLGPLLALCVSGVAWLVFQTGMYTSAAAIVERYSPLVLLIELGQRLIGMIGYPGLVLIIFIENIFPPIPTDIVLPLAGYTAATTTMTLAGAILATTAGSLLGALVLFQLGARLGEERVRRFCGRYGHYLTFEEAELDRSMAWFRRYGPVVVMVARVVPVFRSLISIPAGMSGMPLGRFLLFSALGAGAWNSGLISAGYLLGANWEQVVGWLESYQLAMLSVYSLLLITFVSYRIKRHRQRLQI